MATVFMKWLETRPADYDRGIRLLTLGRLPRLHRRITRDFIQPHHRVLEIGCGTGALTRKIAQTGAHVDALDASPAMLAEAEKTLLAAGCNEQVEFHNLDAVMIADEFEPGSFDRIVAALVFSEMPPAVQSYVLRACRTLLAPGGQLLIADEVLPQGLFSRLAYHIVHLPLLLLTWLLTRTTTSPLKDFPARLEAAGFHAAQPAALLGGSLVLFQAQPAGEAFDPAQTVPQLRHRVTPVTLLKDLWALFFRILPPYPKVEPGLYRVGRPGPDAPVLVTGNFDLTVRRVLKDIDGKVDAWLLVADSSGINVWCAAGGGYFTAERVIAALKSSRVEEVVRHHSLILPQLAANGVDGWKIRKQTGWGVHWGPAKAEHIPAFLAANRKKTDAMRWVQFPLKDRFEMVTVTMGFYGLLILVPVFLFWREMFWSVTASMVGLSYFYALTLPWLPGRDGLYKSIPLTLAAWLGLFAYTRLAGPLPPQSIFNWLLGLAGLSVFTGGELQGMSPLMRGEQANWSWEALIAAGLGIVYWLGPLALGWR